MKRNARLLWIAGGSMLLGGVVTSGSVAQTAAIPDAQVEANVLKAFAGTPELANENITTRTVYGTVTLSGSVANETMRRHAETLASNAAGVTKVVDELRLGQGASAVSGNGGDPNQGQVLQSDGTYTAAPSAGNGPAPGSAPAAQAQRNDPDADQALDQQMQQGTPQTAPSTGQASSSVPNANGNTPQNDPNLGRRPMNGGYPPYGYPQGGGPGYGMQQGQGQPTYGGQVGGQSVTVPAGTLVRVRVNRSLSSNRTQVGSSFDGVVVNDVVAGGVVAIPRGAQVTGTVIDAKSSGVLKGRGELSIQLTQVTLGGKSFPVQTDVWAHHGGDKSIETLDKTAGFGALGAVFGALAGGGVGAAVGGGVGAAAGLGSSAASGRGQVIVPAEGMLAFNLAQPATVTTVSEQEMQRLAYGVPAGGQQPARGRAYYGGYYPYGYPYGYPR